MELREHFREDSKERIRSTPTVRVPGRYDWIDILELERIFGKGFEGEVKGDLGKWVQWRS